MPRRSSPTSKQPAAARLRGEVGRLRARLVVADKIVDEHHDCARLIADLRVYQEETRQQADQLAEAQAALEQSRDRFANLYDFAPVAFLSLDVNGVIESINLRATELLGAERGRLLHLPLLAFIDRPDRQRFLDTLVRCRRSYMAHETEVALRSRGGRKVPVLMSISPRNFTPVGADFHTALIDISDREHARRIDRAYRERLQSLASELSLAEERERRRIAVEVHDNISQTLALAKMKLGAAGQKAVKPEVRTAVDEVAGLLDEVLAQTRSLTFELSPPVLYELGLTAALEWVGERAAARYGLKVAVEVLTEDKPLRLPHETAVLLYQSVRELLTNVAKHAGARHAWVRLRQPDHRLHLTIEDDGVGFEGRYLSAGRAGGGSRGRAAGDTADKEDSNGQAAADAATAFPRDTGFGLFSIRTRLEYLGGSFRIEARPHGGARVTLVVPMASAADGFAEKEQAVSLRSNVDQTHTEAVTHHESTHRRRPPDRARRLA